MNREKIIEDILEREEYKETFKDIGDRKVVVFGATSIGEEIMKHVPKKVSYYIDNDSNKWNKTLNGITIHNPKTLLDEKEEIAIIVTSVHFEKISMQIEELGLSSYMIIDANKEFSRLKTVIKFEDNKDKFEAFIKRMPTIKDFKKKEFYKNVEKTLGNQTIGVVVAGHVFTPVPWYFMVTAALLRYTGSNVIIIWDDVNEFTDTLVDWRYASRYQDKCLENSINLVSEKLDIKVIRVSELEEKDLDEDDLMEIKKSSEIDVIWKYRIGSTKNIFEMKEELTNYKEMDFDKLSYNFRKIKSILDIAQFDRIVVATGLYYYMGLYTWLGKKENIDIGSMDLTYSWWRVSTNGPSGHQRDIKKILEENLLEKDAKEKLIQIGKSKIQEYMHMERVRDKGVFQEISYNEDDSKEQYDIIMPLNIGCDAAALNNNNFFENMDEWAFETVEYILNNTDFSVAVRQHPAEKGIPNMNLFFTYYNSFRRENESGEDLYKRLNERFGENKRFRYIKCDEKINTYKLIEKAKLILPHTSTIGLESVILGKNVLIESNVYYGAAVKKAKSKEDYFEKIKELCTDTSNVTCEETEKALIAYMSTKLNRFRETEFSLWQEGWANSNIEELLCDKSSIYMLNALGNGVPIPIMRLDEIDDL
ncbi:hypothetical protein [Tissierella sp.]|uniref:hypothetical protein n=1 Tax=Tissierella sp. TaxID=41274 RepID=UPI00305EF700